LGMGKAGRFAEGFFSKETNEVSTESN